jgi:hypothetical protein
MNIKQKLEDCCICLEPLENSVYKLPCNHEFHVECIIPSLRKSNECPYCRDTAGNKKANCFTYSSDNESDDNLSIDDYKELEEYIDDKIKDNLDLKDLFKKIQKRTKNAQKSSKTVLSSFNKFLKQYAQNDVFKSYQTDYGEIIKLIKNFKNKINKELKNDGLEIDESLNEDVDDYLWEKNLFPQDLSCLLKSMLIYETW